MKRIGFGLIAFVLLCATTLQAQTTQIWYASPEGTGEGVSRSAPCSLRDALNRVQPDDAITLLSGFYPPDMYVVKTPGVTLTAEYRYGAVLHGSRHHNLVIDYDAHHVTIDGLQIQGAYLDGLKSYANYTTVQYCWIANNTGQGIANHYFRGLRLYRNIIEGNGGNGYAHGVYVSGHDAVIQENIVRLNIGHGLHAYYEGDRGCSNFLVLGNLCYRNGSRNLLVDIDNAPDTRPSVIANNTCVGSPTGITLFGGFTKRGPTLIINNICVQNLKHSFELFQGTFPTKQNALIDYNLTDRIPPVVDDYYAGVPADRFGPHNVVAPDAMFVWESRSFYYLKKSSPARGIGVDYRTLALPGLFPFSPEASSCDAGAIQYHPYYETQEFKDTMPRGPFIHTENNKPHSIPFAWALPAELISQVIDFETGSLEQVTRVYGDVAVEKARTHSGLYAARYVAPDGDAATGLRLMDDNRPWQATTAQVTVWVNVERLPVSGPETLASVASAAPKLHLLLNNDGRLILSDGTFSQLGISKTSLKAGQWHHIGVVCGSESQEGAGDALFTLSIDNNIEIHGTGRLRTVPIQTIWLGRLFANSKQSYAVYFDDIELRCIK